MSRERRKWLRQELVRADRAQVCFSGDGQLLEKRARVVVEVASVDVSRVVFCPFCLFEGKLQRFLVSTKEGISRSKAECPECEAGMLMSSVVHVWKPEEYAQWVFAYARRGFWQKCKWAIWRKRLLERGWSESFWDRYKELKAEATEEGEPESYTEYMARKGAEAAAEWTSEPE